MTKCNKPCHCCCYWLLMTESNEASQDYWFSSWSVIMSDIAWHLDPGKWISCWSWDQWKYNGLRLFFSSKFLYDKHAISVQWCNIEGLGLSNHWQILCSTDASNKKICSASFWSLWGEPQVKVDSSYWLISYQDSTGFPFIFVYFSWIIRCIYQTDTISVHAVAS